VDLEILKNKKGDLEGSPFYFEETVCAYFIRRLARERLISRVILR